MLATANVVEIIMYELSLHILDIVENSLNAEATDIKLEIIEKLDIDELLIRISDNGYGMSEEQKRQILNPYFTTRKTRHIGLGLPLFAAAAEQCGGSLKIDSQKGVGTTVTATFQHSHIDRAPLGDMKTTLLSIMAYDKMQNFSYIHQVNDERFEFNTVDIRNQIGDIQLTHYKVQKLLGEFIEENEKSLSKSIDIK